ncbi:hypothetical protein NDU88_000138 [Pleurodeles waltl]|uniref:Uncharacterized protein n=1 Tax=Pleurodeles waltl TaxID=8319 RepID=A0AAV7VXJ0_PLEWA|nr:hypothetical protein NDU88_000138 [Pleurodeles waltl]
MPPTSRLPSEGKIRNRRPRDQHRRKKNNAPLSHAKEERRGELNPEEECLWVQAPGTDEVNAQGLAQYSATTCEAVPLIVPARPRRQLQGRSVIELHLCQGALCGPPTFHNQERTSGLGKVMQAARHQKPIIFRGDTISFYQDISAHTLGCQREFQAVTHHLRDQKISYGCGYPLRLHFTHQDKRVATHTMDEANKALGMSLALDNEEAPDTRMLSLVDRGEDGDFKEIKKKAYKQK